LSWRDFATSALIACSLVAAWFWWLGDVGFNPWDEGFLWYGVVRTSLGEVPLRDFQAYEPGRYYWAAAWAWLLGPGLMALRASLAVFFAIGLTLGLQVVRRLWAGPAWRVGAALVLLAWAFPRHKLVEPALATAAVWVGVRLAERPDFGRHLQAALFVGLAAFFGRNHALYSGLGLAAVALWSHWHSRGLALPRAIGAFALGGLLGALPLLGLLIFAPGFAEGFLENILFVAREGANVPLPIPWPWRLAPGVEGSRAVGSIAVGAAFMLVPAVILAGLWHAWRGDAERPAVRVVAVATLVGLAYAHHAWVRSDAAHLAQALPPLLLGALALPVAAGAGRRSRCAAWVAVAGLSGVVALTANPHVSGALRDDREQMPIGSDMLRLRPAAGQMLIGVQRAVEDWVPSEEPLLVLPFAPAFYPLLGKKAPLWHLYVFWKGSPEEQGRMIEAMKQKGVDWVLIWDQQIESPQGLWRLRNLHPTLWSHLMKDFRRVRDHRIPDYYFLLRREGSEDVVEEPPPLNP
jgi:hypothetical protein